MASRIKKEDDVLQWQEICYADFLLLYGVEDIGEGSETYLRNTMQKLANKSFWIRGENADEDELCRWITKAQLQA